MMTFYIAQNDTLQVIARDAVTADPQRLAWVDLLNPTEEEETWLEKLLRIEIPTRAEMHEIELSNRFYQENGALYATATIIAGADTPSPETHALTFVLTGNCLVTVRYSDPHFLRAFMERVQKGGACHGGAILAALLEAIVNRIADTLEVAGHHIDSLSAIIFRPEQQAGAADSAPSPDFAEILRQIGIKGDLVSKTRESLISLARLFSFVSHSTYFSAESADNGKLQTLRLDVPALSDHASFLSNKISFLLDATLGLINTQQNTIIKIFSVAAVVFLPPTLVASIYGMNFAFMPELHWTFGYPMAVALMILSAFLPYTFFRKKGWL